MSSDTKVRPRLQLSPAPLHAFHESLRVRRRRLAGGVESLTDEAARASGEFSPGAQHLADLGSDASEQDICLNLLEGQREELRRIDRALERIADGSYGICENCGTAIAPARLEAIPEAHLCILCQMLDESAA